MKNLSIKDKRSYLKAGLLTAPFLNNNYVEEMVNKIYNRKLEKGKQTNKVECLVSWITSSCQMGDENFRIQYKFKRTAQEIWESGLITGCTDFAILFATFARQLGLPTTVLHTAESEWLRRFQSGKDSYIHYGHTFCECFFDNKWILVDPTSRKVMYDYNSDKIILPYTVRPGIEYIPYFRGLDFGKKSSIKEHNLEMDKLCKTLIKF